MRLAVWRAGPGVGAVADGQKTLRIRVEDDGPGIPKTLRTEPCEPFLALESCTQSKQWKRRCWGWASPSRTDIARAHVERCAWGLRTVFAVLRAEILSSPDKGTARVHCIIRTIFLDTLETKHTLARWYFKLMRIMLMRIVTAALRFWLASPAFGRQPDKIASQHVIRGGH